MGNIVTLGRFFTKREAARQEAAVLNNFIVRRATSFTEAASSRANSLPVDKLWENMWVNLWDKLWENFGFLWIKKLYTYFVVKVQVFHVMVEKFYRWFCTHFNRYKIVVLHSFHRAYYYYY